MRTLLALSLSGLILGGVVFAWAGDEEEVVEQPSPADPFGGQLEPTAKGEGLNLLDAMLGAGKRGTPNEPPRGSVNRCMPEMGENEVYLPISEKVVPKPTERPVLELGPKPAAVDETEPNDIAMHLERKAKLVVRGHTLKQVIDQIANETDRNVWIDEPALQEIGVSEQAVIEMEIQGVALGSVLRWMLRQVDPKLCYCVRDGIVMITTNDVAAETMLRYLFDVADLLPPADARGESAAARPSSIRHVYHRPPRSSQYYYSPRYQAADELVELIAETIEPSDWYFTGGSGSVAHFREVIIVQAGQHAEHQEPIERLLNDLRRAKAWDGRDRQVLAEFQLPQEEQWKLMERKVSFDFQDEPLTKVVIAISKMIDTPVQIDVAAFAEIGLSGNAKATAQWNDIQLDTGLQLLLRQIDPDLTWTIKDDVLLLTTREVAEENLLTKVYPVRDLISDDDEVEQLIELIQSTVNPDSWDIGGGPGNIPVYNPARALVITQAFEVHRGIETLLADLRDHVGEPSAQDVARQPASDEQAGLGKSASADDDPSWPIVVYHVELQKPTRQVVADGQMQTISGGQYSLEALPALVQRLNGKQHWDGEYATIELLGGQLIIRQTPEVHTRINRLLSDLDILADPKPRNSQFGGGFGGGGFSF